MTATDDAPHYCTTAPQRPLDLPGSMAIGRQRAIMVGHSKWVNGTVLRYAFFDAEANSVWAAPEESWKEVVRQSFQAWKEIGIGLEFEEVADLGEAEVRIGFDQSDGSWSYVGRDVLGQPTNERTMNIGWSPLDEYGRTTVLHEIGHTLGMPHEHQSPFSGIIWDEEAVYSYFGGPPNDWPRSTTLSNVISKLHPAQVEGSRWDPDSIMEYHFPPGLITAPAAFQMGIEPPGTISPRDQEWIRTWYPGGAPAPRPLQPFQSVPLALAAKQQADFAIVPPASRTYELGTFGRADTTVVLFEEVDGKLRFLAGDDDSGQERNAHLSVKLFQGRRYVLRVRLIWAGQSGDAAAMIW
jgi:hypothetical protein